MKILTAITLFMAAHLVQGQGKDTILGAWEYKGTDFVEVVIYTKGFFSASLYDLGGKRFVGTSGGKYQMEGTAITETIEFDTRQPENVGEVKKLEWIISKGNVAIRKTDNASFKRLDDGGPGQLGGAWLITGRVRDNQLQRSTPGARRTMKILSGTRFQWIAYNVETKEFFGTGGGNYTTVNGKYTENIEIFSRDATRVGMSLVFDFSLENGEWRHKGLSSKGDPIDEVWTQREKIGL